MSGLVADVDDLARRLAHVEHVLGIDDAGWTVRSAGEAFASAISIARGSSSCPRCGAGPMRPECRRGTCSPDGLADVVPMPALEFAPCDTSGDELPGYGWRPLTFDPEGRAHAFLPVSPGMFPAGLAVRVAR